MFFLWRYLVYKLIFMFISSKPSKVMFISLSSSTCQLIFSSKFISFFHWPNQIIFDLKSIWTSQVISSFKFKSTDQSIFKVLHQHKDMMKVFFFKKEKTTSCALTSTRLVEGWCPVNPNKVISATRRYLIYIYTSKLVLNYFWTSFKGFYLHLKLKVLSSDERLICPSICWTSP